MTVLGGLLTLLAVETTPRAIAACTTPPNAVFPEGRWELDCATPLRSPSLVLPLEVVSHHG